MPQRHWLSFMDVAGWDTRHIRELSDHGPVVVDVTLLG
jgi:hypothetical protein